MTVKLSDKQSQDKNTVCSINVGEDKVYNYGDAINLAGNGCYSYGLLVTLSMCTLAMGVDMFGFSVVVDGCTCDFGLSISQTSILLSMPFLGPIVMAYPWGYISDTKGRKWSLQIAMWGAFIVSTACAFSPNWVVMAVLRFLSTSLCSCAQSASYTLLGESTAENVKDAHMLIMTSVLDFSLAVYVGIAYFVLNMNFALDLGFVYFEPWRLLTIILALPLGLGAFGTHFFYESPKFLVNVQREDEAVECLRKIWKRNNGKGDKYPVQKIILNEEGNERPKGVSLIQSMVEQIIPLFKPPLVWKSLMLYFSTAVIFSTNNSFFIWFPFLAERFATGISSVLPEDELGLCNMITNNNNSTSEVIECDSTVQLSLVWASLAQGVSFVIIMLLITKLAHRKKMLMIIIMACAALSSIGAALIKNNIISFIAFFGVLTNELCIGIIYTYFVDLYPTSYRGMAACLGVMVARASALTGVNLLGAFIMDYCSGMFYACGGLMLAVAAIACLLPPDIPQK